MTTTRHDYLRFRLCSVLLLLGLTPVRGDDIETIKLGVGRSFVVVFEQPIRRVSIANPEIADVTVASPKQVLIIGKAYGVTTMIIWDEADNFRFYNLVVHGEMSYQQVMLQVRIAEINKNALQDLGAHFILRDFSIGSEKASVFSYSGRVNTPDDPLRLDENVQLGLLLPGQKLSAVFKALIEKKVLTVLAEPNLMAISGTEASFLAGGEFPVPIVQGTANLQSVTIEYKEYGVRLKFTPKVLSNSLVRLDVAPEVSSLDFENGIMLSGFRVPSLLTRKCATTVELNNGEALMISGLLSHQLAETDSHFPLLGRLPILGKLFSSKHFQRGESELIIVVSPQVVHPLTPDEIPEIQVRPR